MSASRCWYTRTTSPLEPGPIDAPGKGGSTTFAGCTSAGIVVVVVSGTVLVVVSSSRAEPASSAEATRVSGSERVSALVTTTTLARPKTAPIVTRIQGRMSCFRTHQSKAGSISSGVSSPFVRFFAFHLMPYIGLDPSYEGPAWVTVPNELYDPAVGTQLYNR